eukprot:scaffold633262_cov51-Attheya_sp.AAC.1
MTRDGMKEQDGGMSMSKMHRSSSPEWMPEEGEEHELRLLNADHEELASPPSTHVFLPPPQSWFGLDEDKEEDENDGGGSDDHVTSALSSSGSSSSRSGDDEKSVEDSGEP